METLPNELLCHLAEQAEGPHTLAVLLQTNRRLRDAISHYWTRWPFRWLIRPSYLNPVATAAQRATVTVASPVDLPLAPAALAAQLSSLRTMAGVPLWIRDEWEFYAVALNTKLEEAEFSWFADQSWRDQQRHGMERYWGDHYGRNGVFPLAPLSWDARIEQTTSDVRLQSSPQLHRLWMQYVVLTWYCLLSKALRLESPLRRYVFSLHDLSQPTAFGRMLQISRATSGDALLFDQADYYVAAIPELVTNSVEFTARLQFELSSGWVHLFSLLNSTAIAAPDPFDRELELIEVMAERNLLRGVVIEHTLAEYDIEDENPIETNIRKLAALLRRLGRSDLPVLLAERGVMDSLADVAVVLRRAYWFGDLTNIWLDRRAAVDFALWLIPDIESTDEVSNVPPTSVVAPSYLLYSSRPELSPEEWDALWKREQTLFVSPLSRITVLGITNRRELGRLVKHQLEDRFTFEPNQEPPPLPLEFSHRIVH